MDEAKLQEVVKEDEKIANDDGIEISEEILFELKLIAYVTEFMDKHNYKINFYSRRINGVDMDDFYLKLDKTDFFKKFGSKGYKLFEKFLTSRWSFGLPMLNQCHYN